MVATVGLSALIVAVALTCHAKPAHGAPRWLGAGTMAPERRRREPSSRQTSRASLGQLARVSKNDLGLPAVIADLPCHADALAAERGFGGAELGTIISVYNGAENRMGIRP